MYKLLIKSCLLSTKFLSLNSKNLPGFLIFAKSGIMSTSINHLPP